MLVLKLLHGQSAQIGADVLVTVVCGSYRGLALRIQSPEGETLLAARQQTVTVLGISVKLVRRDYPPSLVIGIEAPAAQRITRQSAA
jgi:sRNA-binding carbon storage regulator CsrA